LVASALIALSFTTNAILSLFDTGSNYYSP